MGSTGVTHGMEHTFEARGLGPRAWHSHLHHLGKKLLQTEAYRRSLVLAAG